MKIARFESGLGPRSGDVVGDGIVDLETAGSAYVSIGYRLPRHRHPPDP